MRARTSVCVSGCLGGSSAWLGHTPVSPFSHTPGLRHKLPQALRRASKPGLPPLLPLLPPAAPVTPALGHRVHCWLRLLAPSWATSLYQQFRVLSSDTRSALSGWLPQGAEDERREETGWQRGCPLATGLWREKAAVLPYRRWTDFSAGMSCPLPLLPAFALAVPWARRTLSVPVMPNLLSQSISLLLALQIFATTSSPPGSPSECPQAG